MIPDLEPVTGHLPSGRFPATASEIFKAFVLDSKHKEHRGALWNEWLTATEILANHVPIACAWLSGSFFSAKDEPNDIDCTYWIEDIHLIDARASREHAHVIEVFSDPEAFRRLIGLRVDLYILPWRCNPRPFPTSPEDFDYYRTRGYWDDFWLRVRSGPKGAQPVRLDAIPRRGYLEVMLDGFDERPRP